MQLDSQRAELITKVEEGVEPHIQSGILNRETLVKQGDTITIRYRANSGLSPEIDVYDSNNNQVVVDGVMREVGTTGIYEYDLKFNAAWQTGDYTIVTSESTKGTGDALLMSVITTDIEQVAGQVSAVLGTTAGLEDVDTTLEELTTQIGSVETAIDKISDEGLYAGVGLAEEGTEAIYSSLLNISKQMQTLLPEQGLALKEMFEVSKERSEDIIYLRNKTQELRALVEMNQQLIDNVANEPVIQTWFEFK